jgi:predicted metal-dependent hydrolase
MLVMRQPSERPSAPALSARLDGRSVEYRLRRSARSRGLRVTIDPRAGLVVSVPPSTRRGWADPAPRIEDFLRERQAWVVRHLEQLDRDRESARARGGARDGGLVPYRGELHRIQLIASDLEGSRDAGARRTTVEALLRDGRPALVIRLAPGERRSLDRVLVPWLRDRARAAVEAAVAEHATALGVKPQRVDLRDPRSRWGSASRKGRIMFSWRLVLAPPASLETVVVHELAHLRVFGHGPAFWALVAARRPSHLADRAWLRRNSFALHTALEVAGQA